MSDYQSPEARHRKAVKRMKKRVNEALLDLRTQVVHLDPLSQNEVLVPAIAEKMAEFETEAIARRNLYLSLIDESRNCEERGQYKKATRLAMEGGALLLEAQRLGDEAIIGLDERYQPPSLKGKFKGFFNSLLE